VYEHEAILPVEVNQAACRLAKQNDLDAVVYHNLMMDNIDEITNKRMRALKEIKKDKARIARAYNKKVRSKSFKLVNWCGRQFCLLEQRTLNSRSDL
jgi:hypothetical protein